MSDLEEFVGLEVNVVELPNIPIGDQNYYPNPGAKFTINEVKRGGGFIYTFAAGDYWDSPRLRETWANLVLHRYAKDAPSGELGVPGVPKVGIGAERLYGILLVEGVYLQVWFHIAELQGDKTLISTGMSLPGSRGGAILFGGYNSR